MSATTVLIGLTVVVSLLAFSDRTLFIRLLFEPFVVEVRKEWYRFITHAFVHADVPHLLVNMFVLFMFGQRVERFLAMLSGVPGPWVYVMLYMSAAVVAALPSYIKHRNDPSYRSVGASGAVSAILFAHILMLPTTPVHFLFLPIPIPSFVFGGLYLYYEWYMSRRGGTGVAHDAHLFGALYGIAFTAVVHPALIFRFGSFEQMMP